MEIIYISGAGHSGSTMLDIVLGSREGSFSLGELYYLPDKGIAGHQYCACGATVPECPFWKAVITTWDNNRRLTLEDYIKTQRYYHSTKNYPVTAFRFFFPDRHFTDYVYDTKLLYGAIFEHSGASALVDSSKNPNRILILRKLGYDLKVVHLIRRFSGVLNSNKKSSKKDLQAGIEADRSPLSTKVALAQWVGYNFFAFFNTLGSKKIRIKYEQLISDLEGEVGKIESPSGEYKERLKKRGPFMGKHLAAGNKLRMQPMLYVADKPMNDSRIRFNSRDKAIAWIMDLFY